ncbi:MAG: PLDc N-terminal domain-containing protein [Lachnospiraceae bacterium]|nr:PLDc N-terminal domain-containing protein [Lachnospiraceae bacterium]
MVAGSRGIRLLKKGKRGIFRLIFSRLGIFLFLLIFQLGIFFGLFAWFAELSKYYFVMSAVLSIIMVFSVINSWMDSSAKITWLFIILIVPVFGTLFYFYTKIDPGNRTLKRRIKDIKELSKDTLTTAPDVLEEVERDSLETASLATYMNKSGCFPIFHHTEVTYYPMGEDMFVAMVEELRKAESFIFMEYFIIDEGEMWGTFLDILHDKVRQGVEVRLMYDGMCEFSTLSSDYPERLRKIGIDCRIFAPMTPFLSTHYNNRDHRKICVIDGKVGFTGGVNLADEYINRRERFGVWKDTAIMMKGEAVDSLTLMFLEMWCVNESEKKIKRLQYLKNLNRFARRRKLHRDVIYEEAGDDFAKYLSVSAEVGKDCAGYVIPFGDTPLDGFKLGEHVYMDILNRANHYVHIMTPYLILDDEVATALQTAAARGVDVRIILPGIPDKSMPYALAKSHYEKLLTWGVRIYEFKPGFVHAKVFVSDDLKAVVGTINLDYRSLYHHYECGAYLYGVDCISEIEADFQTTLEDCEEITLTKLKNWDVFPLKARVVSTLVKAFAPLM